MLWFGGFGLCLGGGLVNLWNDDSLGLGLVLGFVVVRACVAHQLLIDFLLSIELCGELLVFVLFNVEFVLQAGDKQGLV